MPPVAGDRAKLGSSQLLLWQLRISPHDELGGDEGGARHLVNDIANAAGLGRTYDFT
jgi:hypothetical protein